MSFLFHDYETFGTNPALDRPSQFAAIRTNDDLEPLGEEIAFYCKPARDVLPHPFACLVTGISPQHAQREGIIEADFARRVLDEMMEPGTCSVGYNSLKFDDQFSRHLFYRNFHDAYAREYSNGNSRWDLINLVRMCYALRPGNIQWPEHEPGNPSFKLEDLTAANNIEHAGAHDALVDVRATIELARLVRSQQPRLYAWSLEMRNQNKLSEMLNPLASQMLVHTSGKIAAKRGCTTLILPLAKHPDRNKYFIVYDLMIDPTPLIELDAEDIADRVFTSTADLPEGVERIPLKTVAINQVPMVAPAATLKGVETDRIQLDPVRCEENARVLREALPQVRSKLLQVFNQPPRAPDGNPDNMLFSGGFFSKRDKSTMTAISRTAPEELAGRDWQFEDPRLTEMLFRYRARNWPETLNTEEAQQWESDRQARLRDQNGLIGFDPDAFGRELAEARTAAGENEEKLALLEQVEDWTASLLEPQD